MKINLTIPIVISAAVIAMPVIYQAKQLVNAESRLSSAENRFREISADVERVLELRARQQTIAEQKRPDQDVIARVNSVLVDAGIPTDRFGGLRPESDGELAGTASSTVGFKYRRQTVQVTLRDVTITDLGQFLSKWITSQQVWIPTRLELTHNQSVHTSGLYTGSLLLSATYVSYEGEA